MSESDVDITTVSPVAVSKKGRAAGAKKPASSAIQLKAKVEKKVAVGTGTVPTHPPTKTMVLESITVLNEKGGSSLQAIKKHIAAFYNVEVDKLALYIRRALKNYVEDGKLIQIKGSWKLAPKAKPAKKVGTEKKSEASPKKKAPAVKKAKATEVTSTKSAPPKAKDAKQPPQALKKTAAKAKPTGEKKTTSAAPAKTPKVKLPKTLKEKSPPKAKTAGKKKAAPKTK